MFLKKNWNKNKILFYLIMLFGVIAGSLLVDFWNLLVDAWQVFAAFLWKCLGCRSRTAFGSMLGSFRKDCMNMSGVMLEVLFEKRTFTPCMPTHVSKVSIYLFINFVSVGIFFKIAILRKQELNVQEFAWDFTYFFFFQK